MTFTIQSFFLCAYLVSSTWLALINDTVKYANHNRETIQYMIYKTVLKVQFAEMDR